MNFKNIADLVKDAHLYQYADISDTEEQIEKKSPKAFFTKAQWIIIVCAILINVIIQDGYNKDFCGYVISGLSLFVGIFFTFIISLYDKFSDVDFSKYHYNNSIENFPLGVRLKNYYKKTTVLSLYLVVISIICILLLSCTLLFEPYLNTHISLVNVLTNVGNNHCLFTIKALALFLYRSFIFYFMIDFVLITIYLTASIYDYIIGEYNKVKLR